MLLEYFHPLLLAWPEYTEQKRLSEGLKDDS